MRQLSALDAQFLNFETTTNVANVGGLAVLYKDLSREKVQHRLAERMAGVPQLRQRLVRVPLGLDHPYWADDSEVDLNYHVQELTLPPPGDDVQLGKQVARLHEGRLDRTRPLWEMCLIHGLAGGRCGIYTKVHHAAVDGLTGAEVLAALMDGPCGPAGDPFGRRRAVFRAQPGGHERGQPGHHDDYTIAHARGRPLPTARTRERGDAADQGTVRADARMLAA
ncbi:wax ester/triacylglycerol synthase domain-containing protein [Nonomuraea sp. NPDC004186]